MATLSLVFSSIFLRLDDLSVFAFMIRMLNYGFFGFWDSMICG